MSTNRTNATNATNAAVVMRWRRVSVKAGVALGKWYDDKVPGFAKPMMKSIPTIVNVLKRADLDEIERLLTGVKVP